MALQFSFFLPARHNAAFFPCIQKIFSFADRNHIRIRLHGQCTRRILKRYILLIDRQIRSGSNILNRISRRVYFMKCPEIFLLWIFNGNNIFCLASRQPVHLTGVYRTASGQKNTVRSYGCF